MGAVVDDAIHVEIETVKFRYPILGDELRDGRISLAHPTNLVSTSCDEPGDGDEAPYHRKNLGTPMAAVTLAYDDSKLDVQGLVWGLLAD